MPQEPVLKGFRSRNGVRSIERGSEMDYRGIKSLLEELLTPWTEVHIVGLIRRVPDAMDRYT